MMCVKLTIVAAVLLCLAGCSLSAPTKLCWTVRSGLQSTRTVFIDGELILSGTNKNFNITTNSSVLSAQISKGPGNFPRTLIRLPVQRFTCTTTNQTNSRWTNVSFSDSTWQYTRKTLRSLIKVGLRNDMFCRFYLSCTARPTVTRPTKCTTKASTTRATRTTATTTQATTTTSTIGTTTTTTTTTTSSPASLFPTVQGTSGGGIFQAGQPATLQCSFSAISSPTAVTWFLNGVQLIDSNSNTASQSDGSVSATYTISEVSALTTGQYTCQGSNANGAGASGPAITVALNSNVQTFPPGTPAIKQLDGAVNQQVLLQASAGCEGLSIAFQPDGTVGYFPSDNVSFDGTTISLPSGESFAWPSACNTPNVWIWAQISSSEFSVGTGLVFGQNLAASTTTVTGAPALYVAVVDTSYTNTIYLY